MYLVAPRLSLVEVEVEVEVDDGVEVYVAVKVNDVRQGQGQVWVTNHVITPAAQHRHRTGVRRS